MKDKKERTKSHLLTQRETSERCVEGYLTRAGVKYKRLELTDDEVRCSQYTVSSKTRHAIVSCHDDGRIVLSFLDIDDDVRTPCSPITIGLTMGELENMVNKAKEFVQ